MKSVTCATALTIAGFDPSAGAGILADLKTFASHKIFGQACITGLTVQSTTGVKSVKVLESKWITQTLTELSSDNSFAVIKIGALFSAGVVAAVAEFLAAHPEVPVVCDPVLHSTSGFSLLDFGGLQGLQSEILPKSVWITPNWPELAALTRIKVSNLGEVEQAAQQLGASYPQTTILVTGGDQSAPDDFLLAPGHSAQWVAGEKIVTSATHGTGCTLSSAIASRIALYPEEPAPARVKACKRYVEGAMRHAPGVGCGHGPLNHFWK